MQPTCQPDGQTVRRFLLRLARAQLLGAGVADTAVDAVVLFALAQMIDHIARQRRELHVLEGMLPICGFCKRIGDGSGEWRQLERYIAERSEAKFSHTFCPDCGKTHYGRYAAD